MEEDYAQYLARTYGGAQEDGGMSEASYATTSVATQVQVATRPASRPATAAARPTARQLSRNRAAKRAATDVSVYNHLSTMYHMNRRIYEMYSKAGLLRSEDGSTAPSNSRPATSWGPPSVAGVSCAMAPSRGGPLCSAPSSRPATAPSSSPIMGQRQHEAGIQGHADQQGVAYPVGATAAPAAAPLEACSFVKRHVSNTAAALKAAILDEIVEHRVYEGQRLKALLRSYLKLNAGEAFYPTLAAVVEELKLELGVA